MITIIKDGEKIRCSQNTYDSMYKRLGYEIVAEDTKEKIKEKAHKLVEKTKEKDLITPYEELVKNDVSKETEVKKNTRTRTRTKTRTKKGE